MRVAFTTRPFSDRSLTEAIRAIGEIGYDGVEIVADFPHAFPAHVTPAVLELVRGMVADTRLKVGPLNAVTMAARGEAPGPSWVDRDREVRLERFRYTIDCIRMAGFLGAPAVVVPAGGAWREGAGTPESRAHDWLEHGLRRLLPLAEEFGVEVLLETGPGLLVETHEGLRHLLRRLEHPLLGASVDVGHVFSAGEDPATAIEQLGPRVKHVHVADVPATREHMHLVPGRGAIDLASVTRALRNMRYRGFLSVDLGDYDETPEGAASEALDALRTHLRE
jgi:sugar phosphate isomerase/epimerase